MTTESKRRTAETYDNAYAESFFSRYKAELLEGGAFADVSQARAETFAYIEIETVARRSACERAGNLPRPPPAAHK